MSNTPQAVMQRFSWPPMEELIPKLFLALAGDLSLAEDPAVLHAGGLLSAKKYRTFLALTATWGQQLYDSTAETAGWFQLRAFLQKYPFDDPSIDRREAALEKFRAAEHRCKRVNARFRARRNRRGKPWENEPMLNRARAYIQGVIGDEPNLPKIYELCGFPPGASVGVAGNSTHWAAKLEAEEWSVNPGACPYVLSALLGDQHMWEILFGTPVCFDAEAFRSAFEKRCWYVPYNKIVTVPKTALSERTIAVEPLLNGYLQKGIDRYLRELLKAAGLDLSSQTQNQLMALAGSLPGFNPFCTIDLKSASDMISIELLRELLPPSWFAFLNTCRSPQYMLNGELHVYEKFVSMGNGFCFPLETLVFASLVSSAYAVTGDREFRVYGDDIIVRQSAALLVLEHLKYCGFTPNVDKTFVFGSFRESCGADFMAGKNVRPYYLDNVPEYWDDVFGILNGLYSKDATRFGQAWEMVFNKIPFPMRYCRPQPGPDSAITVNRETFMGAKHSRWDRQTQSWSWVEVRRSPVFDAAGNPAVEMYGVVRGLGATPGARAAFARRYSTTVRPVRSHGYTDEIQDRAVERAFGRIQSRMSWGRPRTFFSGSVPVLS